MQYINDYKTLQMQLIMNYKFKCLVGAFNQLLGVK